MPYKQQQQHTAVRVVPAHLPTSSTLPTVPPVVVVVVVGVKITPPSFVR